MIGVPLTLHLMTSTLVKLVDHVVFGQLQSTDPDSEDRRGQSDVYQLIYHFCLILIK